MSCGIQDGGTAFATGWWPTVPTHNPSTARRHRHAEFGLLKILMRNIITKTFMDLFQTTPKKNFYVINTHVILNRSDAESFCLGSGTAPWNFSDIGAHQDFQKPEFLMPELLLKEL